MTELQTIALSYIAVILLRFPRIKERWAAPLLRGPEWFFDVAVPPDFLETSGRAILRYYRWRLFIPWSIEAPSVAALWLIGQLNIRNLAILILVITLFTRFNYYAARLAAEKRARAFERSVESTQSSGVMLSLQPRTLRNYTNWWIEAGIVLALSSATGWLAVETPNRVLRFVIINLYLQAGLLLIKYGVIRSSGAAPVDNVEQYLAWRESLRRFSTGACDIARIMFAVQPILALGFLAGGTVRWLAWVASAAAAIVIIVYEWRSRRKHLEVASRTKPARLPLPPDFEQTRGVLGFWPSLPLLLLKTANGYALNLASVPVRIAGLYFAGFAGLWFWLVR